MENTKVISKEHFVSIFEQVIKHSMADFNSLNGPLVEDKEACRKHLTGETLADVLKAKDEKEMMVKLFDHITIVLLCTASLAIIGFEKEHPEHAGKALTDKV